MAALLFVAHAHHWAIAQTVDVVPLESNGTKKNNEE